MVHWEVIFDVQPVFVLVASPKIRFVNTDHFMVFPKELWIPGLEFIRHVEIGFQLDFLVGHESLSFGFQFVDELVHHSLVQLLGNADIFPLLQGTDELLPPKVDGIGGRIGYGQFADPVHVDRKNQDIGKSR